MSVGRNSPKVAGTDLGSEKRGVSKRSCQGLLKTPTEESRQLGTVG